MNPGRESTPNGDMFALRSGATVEPIGCATMRRREARVGVERTGADAVLFVVFLNFLIGFVVADQAMSQASVPLAAFEAKLLLADLVGLSITRELTPLVTAIVLCGWSGAAFTAEIGAMRIAGEIDALRTFGLRPFAWLAVPRVVALLVITPVLTILGDVVGMLGGLAYAVTATDLTMKGYLIETEKSIHAADVVHGLTKSVVFAIVIGLIACKQGLVVSGGAAGVGRRTTSSVVRTLFALVVLDALLTLAFGALGF